MQPACSASWAQGSRTTGMGFWASRITARSSSLVSVLLARSFSAKWADERAVWLRLPLTSRSTPILKSLRVGRIRIFSDPDSFSRAAMVPSRPSLLPGGMATVNHRLNSWLRA